MRLKGILKTWDEERGFGFISPTGGGDEVFVHISEFPRDGSRPAVGEWLSFEIAPGKDGRQQAVRIRRRPTRGRSEYKPSRAAVTIIVAVLLVALSTFAYYTYQSVERQTRGQQPAPAAPVTTPEPSTSVAASRKRASKESAPSTVSTTPEPQELVPPETSTTPESRAEMQFRCDGRTRCSQMTSCAEAKFFLTNCHGTQMDGDHDGIPCEQQWCTSPF